MSSLFKKLSKIDDATKYGVYGWIRKAEEELNLCHIPHMISSICILYYHEDDIFDVRKMGKFVHVSDDKKCVTFKNSKRYYWQHCNLFGTINVPSTNDLHYRWDLKVHRGSNDEFLIGISAAYDSFNIEEEAFEQTGPHYLFYSGYGSLIFENNTQTWKEYGTGYGNNDKVSIELNLRRNKIKFYVNGIDQGVAYQGKVIKKDKDIYYRLLVAGYKSGKIEIIGFQKLNI